MVVGNLYVGIWGNYCQLVCCLYCSKCSHLEKEEKDLLTHYQYRKSCALALISRTQSEEADHTRCSEATGETNSSSSVGRPRKVRRVIFVETRSTSRRAPEKACRVNEKTLDPVHGR